MSYLSDVTIDAIDKDSYSNVCQLRQQYDAARRRLGLPPKRLTPPTLGMRSVR